MKYFYLIIFIFLLPTSLFSQVEEDEKIKSTPYELMSSYYNEDFHPFEKGTIYFGFSAGLQDRQMENTDNLFQTVIDGNRTNYNIQFKSGYYINDYAMIGLNASVLENKFEGLVLRDADSIQSKSIKRGFAITPNYRTSIPLTKNERLSFFTTAGLTFGMNTILKREIKNVDEISKSYDKNYNFRVGLSPGITFFALENFALEVQLDVMGYEMSINDKTIDGDEKSKDVRHNIDFNVDILSMKLGMAYYL